MEATVPVARKLPPASAAAQRETTAMSGDVDEEDKQTEKAPALEHDEEEMSEVRQGLNLLGFRSEVVTGCRGRTWM